MISYQVNIIDGRHRTIKPIIFYPFLRALFLFFFFFTILSSSRAQTPEIDSMAKWVDTHPLNDSLKIYMLHHLSYKLSEIDTKRSFDYYERVFKPQ